MHPRLLEIPVLHLPIYSYGFMVMLGFLAAIFIASRRARQINVSPETILDLGIIAMISGVLGARLAYLAMFPRHFDWQAFNIFDGGLNIIAIIIGWFIPYVFFLLTRKKTSPDDQKRNRPLLKFTLLFTTSIISAVIIGRLVHLILHQKEYGPNIFKFLYIWEGGLVFYGGLLLAVVCGIFYLQYKRVTALKIADLLAPVTMLGLALGRVGCYLNGCCYGKIALDLPWAVEFPNFQGKFPGSPAFEQHVELGKILKDAPASLPVHPIQIYSSFIALILFVFLSVLFYKNKDTSEPSPKDGVVVAYLLIAYPVARFLLEFLRGDNERVWTGLTVSQIISGFVFLIGLGFWYYISRKYNHRSKINDVHPSK
ncbi:MAG: prolipoprotein diacylglyceryl transferase [Planctomycetota bacterium]